MVFILLIVGLLIPFLSLSSRTFKVRGYEYDTSLVRIVYDGLKSPKVVLLVYNIGLEFLNGLSTKI